MSIFTAAKSCLRDRLILVFGIAALALNIWLWLWPRYALDPLREQIPLHYNIYHGVDAYGPQIDIYILPLAGLAMLLLDVFLAGVFVNKHKLFARILLAVAVASQVALLVALWMILNIN